MAANVKRLGFVGKSRLALIEAALSEAMLEWSEAWRWDHSHELPDVIVTDGSQDFSSFADTDLCWTYKTQSDRSRIWLGCAGGHLWRDVIFGQEAVAVPQDEVTRQLIEQAQSDLLDILLASVGLSASGPLIAEDLGGIGRRANGYISAEFVLANARIIVLLHALNVPKASTVRDQRDGPLYRREEAIGEATMDVRVRFRVNRIAAIDLAELKVGHVIRCDHGLDEPFDIAVDETTQGQGYLGQVNGRMALRLLAE